MSFVGVARPGSFCAPEGSVGHTAKGIPAVCSARIEGERARWRHQPGFTPSRARPSRRILPYAPVVVLAPNPPAPPLTILRPGGGRELTTPSATMPVLEELTELDRAVLEFESQVWRTPGEKLSAIRKAFPQLSLVQYFQRLNALIDVRAAREAYPELISRLGRIRVGAR